MLLVKSITIDDKDIGQAVMPAAIPAARDSDESSFLERLRSKDAVAFDRLVDRYSGDVYAVLYRLTEDSEEAADLTQDTFLRALRSIGSFRGDSEIKTWLIRIAINESRNRFRWWKRRRRGSTVSLDSTLGDTTLTVADTIHDTGRGPEELALGRERELALRNALLELNSSFREVVVLCDIEGLSYEETAKAVGCSIGTVKSRLSRGREELRKKLKGL